MGPFGVRSLRTRANALSKNCLISRNNRTGANGREHLPRIDKLGVTGSSPVPPILARVAVRKAHNHAGQACRVCPRSASRAYPGAYLDFDVPRLSAAIEVPSQPPGTHRHLSITGVTGVTTRILIGVVR